MSLHDLLGAPLADTVRSVGTVFDLFAVSDRQDASTRSLEAWHQQFSPASIAETRERRTVRALFRGATVRL